MKDFTNKVVALTGAGSGIGRELAKQLAAKGAILAINDFNAETLNETYQYIIQSGGKASQHVFDVSKREAVETFAADILAQHGQIDVVINNAGVALHTMFVEEVSYEELEWIFGINLWGVIYGTKTFLPHLLNRPEASIVNVSSVFGLAGIAQQAPYCTTKFGVRGFTESLRTEMQRRYPHVVVSTVHPGGIKTNIVRNSRTRNEAGRAKLTKVFDEKLAKTTAEKAAEIIINGIQNKKVRILVGKDARQLDRIIRWLPAKYTKLFIWMQGKKGV